ncbi:MAG: tRNA 2-thiouridine(34) synthase MnmA [Anaerolineae bacterium]|nr:tRNA 2-thiouridine(34) synthase MnmA [Anaerolineae bacterium]
MSKIVVAMSGGGDSSVAAALLKEQGHEVIGMMLRLWSQPGKESENACCTLESVSLAEQVAQRFDIPFHTIDAKQPFRDVVVDYFLQSYEQGQTPNPCLMCNRHIRWGILLEEALKLGADFIASGHYVRLNKKDDGEIQLLRGVDRGKDQAYVLHVLKQDQLKRSLFPVGGYSKLDIRALARDFNLPVATKSDSQDLCFLSGGDYRDFLSEYAPQTTKKGEIVTSAGKILGEHQGLASYTIGQRKGLGIAAPNPLYVLGKDMASNRLIVGEAEELGSSEMFVNKRNWISGKMPKETFRAEVKIRYAAREAWAEIMPIGADQAKITFDAPQRDITPGQAAVFYNGEICLGGGTIQSSN